MIKFLDLKVANKRFETQFQEKFKAFLGSGNYVLGNEVRTFETAFAEYCGTKFCIGVGSGLNALHLILEAYKILGFFKNGDEILVPANTYIATILAISHKNLKPILIEPDLNTYNIDSSRLEKAISPNTKAVLGVHLYGKIYDVTALEDICKKHKLLLIEDAAQAQGATYFNKRKVGNLSNAAAFSFYPTKNLGALGDAGAITTNNENLANIIYKLRNYGRVSAYNNDYKGFNSRLDELQAVFLNIKLQFLDTDNSRRQEIAKLYLDNIKSKNIVLPNCKALSQHVYHLFVIRCKQRDKLKDYLFSNGVETSIHYPVPVHKQNAYSDYNTLQLPITEQIHKEVLSLPLNTTITNTEVKKIIHFINTFY